jgi:hypothetical protein
MHPAMMEVFAEGKPASDATLINWIASLRSEDLAHFIEFQPWKSRVKL